MPEAIREKHPDVFGGVVHQPDLFSSGVEKLMFTEQYFDSKIIMQLPLCLTFAKSNIVNLKGVRIWH